MDPLAISNNLKHLSQHSVSALSSVTETSEFTGNQVNHASYSHTVTC